MTRRDLSKLICSGVPLAASVKLAAKEKGTLLYINGEVVEQVRSIVIQHEVGHLPCITVLMNETDKDGKLFVNHSHDDATCAQVCLHVTQVDVQLQGEQGRVRLTVPAKYIPEQSAKLPGKLEQGSFLDYIDVTTV
jgi:outer membrane usher protein FimD/PapC